MARYKRLKDGTFQKIEDDRWDMNEDGTFTKRTSGASTNKRMPMAESIKAFAPAQTTQNIITPPIREDVKQQTQIPLAPVKTTQSANSTTDSSRKKAEQNIRNKYGSYEEFLEKAKKNTMPGTEHKDISKHVYETLISEEEKRIRYGYSFSGLTNTGYQEYLDNFAKNAKDQKQKEWLDKQKENLTIMKDE